MFVSCVSNITSVYILSIFDCLSIFVLRLSTVRSMIYTSYIYHLLLCLLLVRVKILVIYIFALMDFVPHLVNFDIYCIVI